MWRIRHAEDGELNRIRFPLNQDGKYRHPGYTTGYVPHEFPGNSSSRVRQCPGISLIFTPFLPLVCWQDCYGNSPGKYIFESSTTS